MKILVIQITRFGDILCTLPTLSALRRENPDAQIHFLVRSKFSAAAEGFRAIDHLWKVDSQKLLGGLITGSGDVSAALSILGQLITDLRREKYDKIINLSFSPSSSFITHLVARENIPVSGYTRTSDLFLHIPDEPSRYFRSQVGIDRSNRIHVVDLFSWVAGVELIPSDVFAVEENLSEKEGVVCHIGASQGQKMWTEEGWVGLLQKLTRAGVKVTLVGTENEKDWADKISSQISASDLLTNGVGQTSAAGLARLLNRAKLFIGCDSGPLHVADSVSCRTLNLSVGPVRFWETGPLVPGSQVLVSETPEFLSSDVVFQKAQEMLAGRGDGPGSVVSTGRSGIRYEVGSGLSLKPDRWALVEWMYFKGPAPRVTGDLATALSQIQELCDLALQQMSVFHQFPDRTEIVGILDRIDELLMMMSKALPPLAPLLAAFTTQKENIPPGTRDEIFYQSRGCYRTLSKRVHALLKGPGDHVEVERKTV